MLLDPFEKQFDLPAAAIQLGDGQCWQGEIVGEEHQTFAGHRIFEADSTKRRVEILFGVKACQHDSLIANQASAAIDRMRVAPLGFEIGLGPDDKETFGLVQLIKSIEVDVASIHDVESAGLGQQQIENVDVVQFAIADMQERRNVATQIQESVQFDGCLGRAKRRPSKHRKTQIDRAGIQSVDRIIEIDAERFCGIEAAGNPNQRLAKSA